MLEVLITWFVFSSIISAASSARIVGGDYATKEQFPFMVSLRSANNAHSCGGTIISDRWIVSAAHCTASRAVSNITIVLGTINQTFGATAYSVSRIVNHPEYNAVSRANDISLLEAKVKIAFNSRVAPATLATNFTGSGFNATAVGWGQASLTGSTSELLQFVILRTLSNPDCRMRFDVAQAARVFANTICTLTQRGQGTCIGDSGGSLTIGDTIIGVISWGIPCAQGSPDVYARISSHREWINTVYGV